MTLSRESPLPEARPVHPEASERPDVDVDASSSSPTRGPTHNDSSGPGTTKPSADESRPLLDAESAIATRPSADDSPSNAMLHADNVPQPNSFQQSDLRSPSPIPPGPEPYLPLPRPKRSLRQRFRIAWLATKGMILVILSQFFGATMNVMAQILEKDGAHGKGMHPFQVRHHTWKLD